MAYLSPAILAALGLRQRLEDEEEPIYESPMDVYRRGERAPVSPYAGITPPAPSPVAPTSQPSPYRTIPWITEEPSTAKPDEMGRVWREAKIYPGTAPEAGALARRLNLPVGEQVLEAPEGGATWTGGPDTRPWDAWLRAEYARRGLKQPPAGERPLHSPDIEATGQARDAIRAAEERKRTERETQRQNLIAEILSTTRSSWGRSEVDRRARVGELLTVLKEIYGTSALGDLLGAGEGGGAGPGGLVPTGVVVDEKGGIKRTFGLPPSAKIGGGPGSRSYEDYVREAETKGLTGADRTRYAEGEMRKAAEAMATARGVGATAPPVVAGQAAVAGARAAATRGPQLPLTPTEATQAGVPMGTTRGDLAGQIPTTPKMRQSITELDVSQNMLDHLGGLADQLITAEDAVQAAAQGVKLWTAAAARSNTAAAVFADQRRALLGIFSRQIGAERGVLTDRDIERIDDALPRFRDTKAIKDDKLAFLRSMITTNREARTRAIDALLGGRALGGGAAVGGGTLPRPNAGEEVRRDRRTGKSWVRRNGQMIEVQP